MRRDQLWLCGRWRSRATRRTACAVLLVLTCAAHGEQPLLRPMIGASAVPLPPWTIVGLRDPAIPRSRFDVVDTPDGRALRVTADRSYGNLVHALALSDADYVLTWDWRLEIENAAADLRHRTGDDAAIKVCVAFELPLSAVPFVERQRLRIARMRSALPLPAATVCYVWDATLAPDSHVINPFSRRVRYLVLRQGTGDRRWIHEQRHLAADFLALFGRESARMPPVTAIAVGADADNTGGHSMAYLRALKLDRAR